MLELRSRALRRVGARAPAAAGACVLLLSIATGLSAQHTTRQASNPHATARKAAMAATSPAAARSMSLLVPGTTVKIEMALGPAETVSTAPTGGGPARQVAVKPFWIARTETTWEAFDGFTMSGPAASKDDPAPAPDAIARPSKSYIPPDLGW